MRIAHLADLHMGFRQFTRLTATGMNQREADVARAFQVAAHQITQAAPDLIVVAGDVFHAPRPTNAAIVHAVAQFQKLTRVAPVIIVAGNHDSPRAVEGGHILPLLQAVGCQVVLRDPVRIVVGECALWCVPDTGVHRSVSYEPCTNARYNVALVHGEVRGVIAGAPERPSDIDPDVWREGWDHVALGHYHVQQQVAPRAWYAGSLEYTSSNPWAETTGAPKGWLLVDLSAGTVTPQPIPGVRRFVDLPRLDVTGGTPDDVRPVVQRTIAEAGDLTGAAVRMVVVGCDPSVATMLRAQRKADLFGAGVLHAQLDVRRAEQLGTSLTSRASGQRRATLEELLVQAIEKRAAASGIPLERMLAAGRKALADVSEPDIEAVPVLDPDIVIAWPDGIPWRHEDHHVALAPRQEPAP